MVVDSTKKSDGPKVNPVAGEEKTWDNPVEPEKAEDQRDVEQLKRQQEEAERRKENLTDDKN